MNTQAAIRQIMCPFCHSLQILLGYEKAKKMLGCGHTIKFKKTRSQKEMDRKYVATEFGLELKSK